MPEIQGLENWFTESVDENGKRIGTREVVWGYFQTVADAVEFYCKKYGAYIRPYDGLNPSVPLKPNENKYFYYTYADGSEVLVDIHILNSNGTEICIKQNLSYELETDDTIYIGQLIC